MSHPSHTDPRPFLSVICWPKGATREAMAQLLAASTGIDVHTLRLRLGQAPPSIIGQVEPNQAERAAHTIREHGGDAFSVTFADLYALGPAKPVRSIAISGGVLAMELRDGSNDAIRFQDVWLLVQGMIREKARERSSSGTFTMRRRSLRSGRLGAGAGAAAMFGAAGLAAAFGGAYLSSNTSPADSTRSTTVTRNKMHIHDARGAIYEIDSRRFNFNVLGEMKQYNNRANMEQLCELLSHLAPDEIVDPYFPLWKPPPRHHQLRIDGEKGKADRPFAFYSRWVACMYRYITENIDEQMFG